VHSWFPGSGRQRIHFLHVGKSGGTAVKHALKDFLRTPRYTLTLHGHHTSLAHIPPGQSVIFFLRDPISRFVSGFYSRRRRGAPRRHNDWSRREREVFERFATPNDIAGSLADESSPLHGRAVDAMAVIQHFAPYRRWYVDVEYFLSRLKDILFIGFQESMEADFETLKGLLDLPGCVSLPTGDTAAHRNPPGLDTAIGDAGLAALRDWYAEDLEFIRLCRELMSARRSAR